MRDQPYFERPDTPRPMLDRRLADAEPARRGQHRHEAVQLAVQPDLVDHVAAKALRPQLWSCSFTPVSRPTSQLKTFDGHRLCQGSWRSTFQPLTTSKPVVELGQQLGNLGGAVLQVGVDRDDRFAGRRVEPGAQRRRLAKIAAKADAHHARIALGELLDDLPGAVGRAVVDDHDLQLVAAHRGQLAQLAVELFERPGFVEDGNDDADHGAAAVKSGQGRGLTARQTPE